MIHVLERPRVRPIAAFAPFAFAIACLGAAFPARADAPPETRFGFGAEAYAHAGAEAAWSGPGPSGFPEGALSTAAQGLLKAHASHLIARFGIGSGILQDYHAYSRREAGAHKRLQFITAEVGELSLRLRFGPTPADDGILAGWVPLQGNPDAALFGNYLARYIPYPGREGRPLADWDSLGALAPRVAGVRLALGRPDGPARIEGWVVKDDGLPDKFSLIAFLSGRAPRKVDWGLGLSAYRAWPKSRDRVLIHPGYTGYKLDSLGFYVLDTVPPDTTRIRAGHAPILVSARVSLDFAALIDPDAPEGPFGGLFAEAAVLGWEDFPYYYTDRASRLAWTLGARLPAFGALDVCILQWEWRLSPEANFRPDVSPAALPSEGPDQAPPPRPSPWSFGLLMAKRFSPHVEGQIRALSNAEGWYPAARATRVMGRIAFRFR